MRGFIKRLFCRHLWTRVRNSHGDEIIELVGKRTLLECDKCGKLQWVDDYITAAMATKNKEQSK